MNVKAIFLCGPHTSGKTSILKRLKEEHFFQRIELEIGKELYYQRKFSTERQGEDFEREVTRLELERDRKITEVDHFVGIETWHPGNLAYAMVRNPHMVDELAERMKKSPLIDSIMGIYLDIPREIIFQRTKTFQADREWAADFYSKINGYLPQCIEKIGLSDRTIHLRATGTFEEVLMEVKTKISEAIFNKK